MVTIHDVARRAGVSIATVSYAMSNKNRLKAETRERIKRIAEELGYVPNPSAQSLHSKRTDMVGVIVPAISNAYTAVFIQQLEEAARLSGYYLLLACSNGRAATEREIVKSFIGKHVDALIVTPGASRDISHYHGMRDAAGKLGVPMLFTHRTFPDWDADYVVPDLEDGSLRMTAYLLEAGYRDLLFVGGHRSDYYMESRLAGFRRAQLDKHPDRKIRRPLLCGYGLEAGYQAAKRLLDNRSRLPGAFVAINDETAYGIYKALKEAGIRVPDDVGLTGYDDLDLPTVDAIPLTTMRIPVGEMARMCLQGIERIRESPDARYRRSVKPELVVRSSTGRRAGPG